MTHAMIVRPIENAEALQIEIGPALGKRACQASESELVAMTFTRPINSSPAEFGCRDLGSDRMMEQKDVAREVSQLMLGCSTRLDASVALVKEKCSPEELQAYRRAVGKIMGEMLLDIRNPLYAKHPDLKPKELKWKSARNIMKGKQP